MAVKVGDPVAELQDNSAAVRASISNSGDDTLPASPIPRLPTTPTTPLGDLARKCLLNEFPRLDAQAAARKPKIRAARSVAMKRYWALRKARTE